MVVTLKAIAERAGVSPMVVSAALHNTAGIRVSEAKRELIRRTASEMGYRPNLLARTLSGGHSRMLGAVIDSTAPGSCFAVLRHIEAEATRLGYRIMIAEEHNSVGNIATACQTFEQYGVDGVICLAHDYPDQRADFEKLFCGRKNMVMLEKAEKLDCPYVEVDPRSAFREALRHFLALGRKPGMVISDLAQIVQQKRIAVYREVCDELGIEAHLYYPPFHEQSLRILDAMETCLNAFIRPGKIDAILIQNDLYGAGMLAALDRHALKSPEDLAIIAWDNCDFCDLTIPPLASIDNDYAAQGKALVRQLLDVLAGGRPENVFIASRLVLRKSAGIAKV